MNFAHLDLAQVEWAGRCENNIVLTQTDGVGPGVQSRLRIMFIVRVEDEKGDNTEQIVLVAIKFKNPL